MIYVILSVAVFLLLALAGMSYAAVFVVMGAIGSVFDDKVSDGLGGWQTRLVLRTDGCVECLACKKPWKPSWWFLWRMRRGKAKCQDCSLPFTLMIGPDGGFVSDYDESPMVRAIQRLCNYPFRSKPWVPADQRNEEGETPDFGNPDCEDYLPRMTREQRIEAARQWRERMAER